MKIFKSFLNIYFQRNYQVNGLMGFSVRVSNFKIQRLAGENLSFKNPNNTCDSSAFFFYRQVISLAKFIRFDKRENRKMKGKKIFLSKKQILIQFNHIYCFCRVAWHPFPSLCSKRKISQKPIYTFEIASFWWKIS